MGLWACVLVSQQEPGWQKKKRKCRWMNVQVLLTSRCEKSSRENLVKFVLLHRYFLGIDLNSLPIIPFHYLNVFQYHPECPGRPFKSLPGISSLEIQQNLIISASLDPDFGGGNFLGVGISSPQIIIQPPPFIDLLPKLSFLVH